MTFRAWLTQKLQLEHQDKKPQGKRQIKDLCELTSRIHIHTHSWTIKAELIHIKYQQPVFYFVLVLPFFSFDFWMVAVFLSACYKVMRSFMAARMVSQSLPHIMSFWGVAALVAGSVEVGCVMWPLDLVHVYINCEWTEAWSGNRCPMPPLFLTRWCQVVFAPPAQPQPCFNNCKRIQNKGPERLGSFICQLVLTSRCQMLFNSNRCYVWKPTWRYICVPQVWSDLCE